MKDEAHLAWIRAQPCAVKSLDCFGSIHAHHRTGAGLGLKASDRETMPLCLAHHCQRHELTGYFKGWTKQALKDWEKLTCAQYDRMHKLEGSFDVPPLTEQQFDVFLAMESEPDD